MLTPGIVSKSLKTAVQPGGGDVCNIVDDQMAESTGVCWGVQELYPTGSGLVICSPSLQA